MLFFSCGNTTIEKSDNESIINNKKNEGMKKVLFVITSHDELGNTGEKTGVWLEEFAGPYYFMKIRVLKSHWLRQKVVDHR